MRTYSYNLIPSSTPASTASNLLYQSSGQSIEYAVNFSVQATFTGASPLGVFSILGSNDNVNYVQVAGTSGYVNGTSGSILVNVPDAAYRFIKAQFSSSAGSTGLMQAVLFTKGWQ